MQANGRSRDRPESQSPPGVVELREDVPLKAGVGVGVGGSEGTRWCAAGPRLILACFAILTVAITIALLTQIYYGDYQVIPHGSVASDAASCSGAGTDALKNGGLAMDAAVAAALCLAVLHPHRTSLDASGALVYWEYGRVRAQEAVPVATEWSGAGSAVGGVPRLVSALAALHARFGVLPWSVLLQPAIDLARNGFVVSEGLSIALAAEAGAAQAAAGTNYTAPQLADYLESLQHNTSSELSLWWGSEGALVRSPGVVLGTDAWRWALGGAGAAGTGRTLLTALQPPPTTLDDASRRIISAMQAEATGGSWPPTGVATGLAIVDQHDTYVALVTGLSVPFGSGGLQAGGWRADTPSAPPDLAPALMVQHQVCGTRYVLGAESSVALAQAVAALTVDSPLGGGTVERSRVALATSGALAAEALRPAPPATALPAFALVIANASLPYAAVNVVQQIGDALLSHADSRGGGFASRF